MLPLVIRQISDLEQRPFGGQLSGEVALPRLADLRALLNGTHQINPESQQPRRSLRNTSRVAGRSNFPLLPLAPDLGHPRIAPAGGAVVAVAQRVFPVVILMVFLGPPEHRRRGQFGVDVPESAAS